MPEQKQHFLLAPSAAIGHYIPFLGLARRLLQEGCRVTLFAAKSELDQLRDSKILTPEDEKALHIKKVPYERHSVTSSAPDQGPADLFRLHDLTLQKHIIIAVTAISEIIKKAKKHKKKINAVILDYYFGPAVSACLEHGMPYFIFNTSCPRMALSLLTITEETPVDENTQMWPTMQNFANKDPVHLIMKEMTLSRKEIISKSRGLILNSFHGLADGIVGIVQESKILGDIPILQIGPLFETPTPETKLTTKVENWLDQQAEDSVIHVAFGAAATPDLPQMTELANALLESKRPFIWSLPGQYYHTIPQLTDGFPENHSPESPFLLLPWSPQKTILGHKATGLFVTYNDWNSTMECLASGKPTVSWPMLSCSLNAEWLAGLGTGVMVHGTGMVDERVVSAQEIAETFDRVLAGETFKSEARIWEKKVAAALDSGGSYHTEFLVLLAAASQKPQSGTENEDSA